MQVLKVFATIVLIGTFGLPTDGSAQTTQERAEANALFVDAARTYAEANATSGRERIVLLREVASTLDLISEQYPDTLPARRIEERTLGSIDLAAIEAAVDPLGAASSAPVSEFFELYAERNGRAFTARLIEESRWVNSPEQSAFLGLMVAGMVSNEPGDSPAQKVSVLGAVLDNLARRAGGDGEMIRIMNYARNTHQGGHPTREEVRDPVAGWSDPVAALAKEFHIIEIEDPRSVEKYIHPDGSEAVFLRDTSGRWGIMQDGTNDATYNFVVSSPNPNDFYQHMVLDVAPWLLYGVSPDDRTNPADRIEAFERSGLIEMANRVFGTISDPVDSLTETLESLPSGSMMTGPLLALSGQDVSSPTELVAQLRSADFAFYEKLSPIVDDGTLERILTELKVDVGDDYNEIWSSPVYQPMLEGFVKVMLSPEVQRMMAFIGIPDSQYIYALDWPSVSDVRSKGTELALDYSFDYAISLLEDRLAQDDQPWDGGSFEGLFDTAIPETLRKAKFVIGSLSNYRDGEYIDLAVGVFTESASVASDLYEASLLFREVRDINRGTIDDAIEGGVSALRFQEVMGVSGQRLPLQYSAELTHIAGPLMNDSQAWTVDTGRKLRIIGELVLIRSQQLKGRDLTGYIETLNNIISEYEGTPISVWDSFANTVTFGTGGTREYSSFSREVATRIGLAIEGSNVTQDEATESDITAAPDAIVGQSGEWGPSVVVPNGHDVWGLAYDIPPTLDTNIDEATEADTNKARSPLGELALNVSAGFFDSTYPAAWNPPAQHLGTDLPAPNGTQVMSPVAGTVLLNRTDREDAFEKHLIVRSAGEGHDHVFGHINSQLSEGESVEVGTPLGTIVSAGTGPHVHWGINTNGVLEALGSGWGWGRAPLTATVQQAADRGWIDPALWFEVESGVMDLSEATGIGLPPSSGVSLVDTNEWGPEIVISEDLRQLACDRSTDIVACLREFGLSEEAINFSMINFGDSSGTVFATEFTELGTFDVAQVKMVGGNRVFSWPVILNGTFGFKTLVSARSLTEFSDEASAQSIASFPLAELRTSEVVAHRRLPTGAQRFVKVQGISDFCQACPIIGQAISFHDVSVDGNVNVKRIGIELDTFQQNSAVSLNNINDRPKSLQAHLNLLGYEAGPMDGFAGAQTRQALMEFQVEHCLTPTGQPDASTVRELVTANGFTAPCGGTSLPDGISANAPLMAGIYVDDLSICQLQWVPDGNFMLRQRLIHEGTISDAEMTTCSANRTDIRDGLTLFRGQCCSEGGCSDDSWPIDVLSSDSFVDIEMGGLTQYSPELGNRPVPPRTFNRCSPDSLLWQTWHEEFPDEKATQPTIPVTAMNSNQAQPSELLQCTPAGQPSFPERMRPIDSSTHSGRTVSGNSWGLRLFSPGLEFGDAEFTNSAGVTVEGFWRITDTGICQSYNGRESWICHAILACEGETNRFAMRNSEGEITSVLETSVGQTYETDSLMEDGNGLDETFQPGTPSQSLFSSEGRKFSVSTPQGRAAFEVFDDSHYVVIAARPTLLEAQQLAANFTNTEYQIAIFESQNGWFAVTGALLNKYAGESPQDFTESVASLIEREGFPDDAYLTQGQSFVRLMPLAPEHTFTNPYFIRSSVIRETEMFWAELIDGKVEATPEGYTLSQGEDVTVWEQLGDYCVIGPFEPFAVACADVMVFAEGSNGNLQTIPNPAMDILDVEFDAAACADIADSSQRLACYDQKAPSPATQNELEGRVQKPQPQFNGLYARLVDGTLVNIPSISENALSRTEFRPMPIRRVSNRCVLIERGFAYVDIFLARSVSIADVPIFSPEMIEEFVINSRFGVNDVKLSPIVSLREYLLPAAERKIAEENARLHCADWIYGLPASRDEDIDRALSFMGDGPLSFVESELQSGRYVIPLSITERVMVLSDCATTSNDFRIGPIDEFNTRLIPAGDAGMLINQSNSTTSEFDRCAPVGSGNVSVYGMALSIGQSMYLFRTPAQAEKYRSILVQ